MNKHARIAFAWSGLPDYAARCIRAVIDRHPGRVDVIGTIPQVPISGMEASLGQAVTWIDGFDDKIDWSGLQLDTPDIFFRGGHFLPAFRKLGRLCRNDGGKVVTLADTTWQGTWKQKYLDPIRHRLILRNAVDGCFVPGKSGVKHARLMGYNPEFTHAKMLGADPSLFGVSLPTSQRPKRIIFVGNVNTGKNIIGACSAFQSFAQQNEDWEFHICGTGPLESEIPRHRSIRAFGFQQPAVVAQMMSQARVLILPSLAEAWGLVVHEAALSGCALALSDVVGAREDFCTSDNSVIFPANDVSGMEHAMRTFASWTDSEWDWAGDISRARGREFGPAHFADSVELFITKFRLARSSV